MSPAILGHVRIAIATSFRFYVSASDLLRGEDDDVTELNFKGKEFVYNHHLAVPFRPVVPNPQKGIGPVALDGNLILHGDNLHALKALLPGAREGREIASRSLSSGRPKAGPLARNDGGWDCQTSAVVIA